MILFSILTFDKKLNKFDQPRFDRLTFDQLTLSLENKDQEQETISIVL